MCYTFVTVTSGQCSYVVATGTPATNISLTWQTTTLPVPGGVNLKKTVNYTTDPNFGNIQQEFDWNYYTGTLPASADRKTAIAYLNTTPYINVNILNRPTSVTVTNKTGATVAQTTYCYDYSGGCGGSSFVSATGKKNHDDAGYGTSNTVRGDLTQVKRLIGGSNYLMTSKTYDMTGQVKTSTDSNGNVTQYDYSDNFYTDPGDGNNPSAYSASTPTNAYPKTVTYPMVNSVTLTKTFGYYWGTGVLALMTDENTNSSYSHFNDSMNRATASSLPNGGWTRTRYSSNDEFVDSYTGLTSGPPSGNSTPTCTGTLGGCRWDEINLDPLGRLTSQVLESDPDGATTMAMTYDYNGRVASKSNPYRGSSNGVETPSYDGLDRAWKVTRADTTSIAYTYYGTDAGAHGGASQQLCASSTYGLGYPLLAVDEAGNKRQTWTDGFGRVIETDEPGSSGSLTVGTCYTYDLNNNLTQIMSLGLTQTQKPTYTYDMISRVTSKVLPESGTTNFYYTTSVGSLCSGDPKAVCRRADARNITTTYTYDALNRLTSISYNDSNPTTPAVKYGYDAFALTGCTTTPPALTIANGKGRRTSMCDGSGATSWSFDSVGNIASEKRTLNGQTKQTNYAYNLDSSIYTLQYPGTRTITYTAGNAQRMTQVADTTNSINYVKLGAAFSPFGAVASVIHGYVNGVFAGITESYTYNNRLEVTAIQVTSSAGTPLNLAYSYPSGNNGNISTQTNNVSSGRTQNYSYDSLNRLLTAQTQATSGGDCWGQSFGNNGPPPTLAADALANLFYTTATQCTAPQPSFTMNTSNNNRFADTGMGYDADGDVTQEPALSGTTYNYTYDAENRIITASGMTNGPYCYTYDGNGVRVMKAHASGGSCTGTVTVDMLYWRDITGAAIAETDGNGNTNNSYYNEYVFFAGRRIAQSNPSSGNVYYYFVDHLGSTRVVTNATGTACYEVDYLPYGTENTPAGFSNTCTTRYRFTGYERDLETAYGTSAGNDYAFVRYYNSRLERFMSRDPLGGDTSDPQSLNGYSYVRNKPINFIDPLGLDPCIIDNSGINCTFTYSNFDDPFVGYIYYDPWVYGLGMEDPTSYLWCIRNYHTMHKGAPPPGTCRPGWKPIVRKPKSPGFTLGVRQSGQTFSACLAQNSGNYSIAGVSNIQNSGGQFVLGNDVANLLFGNTSEGAGGLVAWEGGTRSIAGGIGTAGTMGRRTSSIMHMNIAGTRGGTKGGITILGKTGAEEIAGWLSGVAELKLAGDVGLTGAEVIGCLINQ